MPRSYDKEFKLEPVATIYYYGGSDVINISETANLDGGGAYPQINANGQVVWEYMDNVSVFLKERSKAGLAPLY